jgi:hypothetical protein
VSAKIIKQVKNSAMPQGEDIRSGKTLKMVFFFLIQVLWAKSQTPDINQPKKKIREYVIK